MLHSQSGVWCLCLLQTSSSQRPAVVMGIWHLEITEGALFILSWDLNVLFKLEQYNNGVMGSLGPGCQSNCPHWIGHLAPIISKLCLLFSYCKVLRSMVPQFFHKDCENTQHSVTQQKLIRSKCNGLMFEQWEEGRVWMLTPTNCGDLVWLWWGTECGDTGPGLVYCVAVSCVVPGARPHYSQHSYNYTLYHTHYTITPGVTQARITQYWILLQPAEL